MILNHRTKIAGVIGWPISQSKSPKVHSYWLNKYEVDGVYHALSVSPDRLSPALRGISALGFRGVNLTIPHKVEAMALCDKIDATAERIGAVNTITICEDCSLSGTNSDAYGFIENLHKNSSWTPSLGPAVILGAGGAARAVAVALSDAGVDQIRIINRTIARAEGLIVDTRIKNAVSGCWKDRHEALEGAGLLVNSTNLGMAGCEPLDIDLSMLPRSAVVNDIVYAPLNTELLKTSKNRGNQVVDGLGMLLYQAKVGFHLWYGVCPEVTSDQRSYVLGQ